MSSFGKKPQVDPTSFVKKDLDLHLDRLKIVVYGQPKVGKTWAGGTASEFWPEKFPVTKPVYLDDCFWISLDDGATVGLKAMGITMPEFDVRSLLADGAISNIREAMRYAVDAAGTYVEKHGVKTIVVDTVSMFDFELSQYWGAPENMPSNERGEPDKFGMFREILWSHGKFFQDLARIPARIVYLCHADVNAEAVKPKQSDRDKAKLGVSTLAGTDIDIKPQITGKAAEIYMKNDSLILPMKMFGEAGSKSCERKFLPFGGAGMSGGNRYWAYVQQEEDAHIVKLLKKVEVGQKKLLNDVNGVSASA